MTQALKTFNRAIKGASELLDCYETLNGHESITPPDSLKTAGLIMALTAWETYIEDVVTELFRIKFDVVKGSTIGDFAEKQLGERLKQFHNPDSQKTKRLFEEFFAIDITESWKLNNKMPEQARAELNKWIAKRGEAVHRANVDLSQPHIIRKDDLTKCINFITQLVEVSDQKVEELINS